MIESLEGFAEPVDLLGHSMGGRTILPIAIERPDLVHSLILMDTWADQNERDSETEQLATVFSLPQEEALAALDELWSVLGPEKDLSSPATAPSGSPTPTDGTRRMSIPGPV